VVAASESLRLDGVTIEGNETPVHVAGDAVVINGAFLGNSGLAVSINGEARVEDGRFIGNQGGLFIKRGIVRRVVFSQNTGGAFSVLHPDDRVRIIASRFEGNSGRSAMRLSQRSGGSGRGVVELRRCVFANNSSASGGGAISVYDSIADAPTPQVAQALRALPPARFEIFYTRFTRNSAPNGGAVFADLTNGARLVVRGGIFHENNAVDSGGAIAWDGGTVAVTHTLFRANRVTARGAAVLGGNPANAAWSLGNVLVAENVGGPQGGAVELAGGVLRNVTIARNDAAGFVATAGAQPASIGNSILSENRGGNCRGAPAVAPGNLQNGDASCPGVTVADPYLDSLYVPQLGSVALSAGDPATCVAEPVNAVDIVFQPRARPRCASGAFERPPLRRVRIRRD
jgi:predicted outer membrane repeat protein